MKVYTRTGDRGETGLLGGTRVPKDTPRLEVCGTLDELNAALGMARAERLPEDIDCLLQRVQSELFSVAAWVATEEAPEVSGLPSSEVLEKAIDRYDAELPPLHNFILPAGSRAAAALHLARTVCRRAERRLVTLIGQAEQELDRSGPLVYLNRLSDLLFVLARAANAAAGVSDVPWKGTGG
ncbi:MAG TPA: cob(I)yrinic acid a,c-diamide adenosyltransferase [Thermoguttaceae bacterium]|nr:cob(I)yrinic acid a,c-diamide adenosyltransferase [Thermoguttaceae bacterium]